MASSQSYEGRVPPAKGTGPRNLTKTGTGPQPSMPKARASKASMPRISPGMASPGVGRIPAGGAGGVPKATAGVVRTPKTINKPKTGRPGRGLGKPRADMKSRI